MLSGNCKYVWKDVYKRQAPFLFIYFIIGKILNHQTVTIDVYKRQERDHK